ncbi:MAG: hypothetical protein DI565_04440 [Ancylobacter novellus]|uniref:Sialate O-acetylesterase domain-containing protein n=1 Tax=Ancylobacter novellus TaxID=921 RepID=A0A2W5KQ27_ANCNO|nr:MAG: hypothetical protein DI565_04440 [Ancylobacter novellus]
MRRNAIVGLSLALSLSLGGALVCHGPAGAAERLFVIAGQSNAVSAGGVIAQSSSTSRGATLPKIKIWRNVADAPSFVQVRLGLNTTQYPAKPRQHSNFGPEWGMAQQYRTSFPDEAADFFKFARGGTSLLAEDEWSPTGPSDNLYGQLLTHSRAIAGRGAKAACFVWVQGEADRTENVDNYEAAFRRFVAGVGNALGQTDLKIVWPRLSQTRAPTPAQVEATDRFRAMQTRIAGDPALRVGLVDADDLPNGIRFISTARAWSRSADAS